MLIRVVRETTLVNHGLLEKGQTIESDEKHFSEKTLQRWIRRGIAVEVTDNEYYTTEEVMDELGITAGEVERDKLPDDKTIYATDVVESEIADMTFQELRRHAKDNGYENYGKMNREELIELLTEEEAEEKSPFFDGNE